MSISADYMSFKDRLQKAAEHAGVEFGPSSIARSLGLKNRQTVHRWLADDSIPEPEMLFHIAKTYGVEAVWLGSGDGAMVSAPPQDLSPPEKELVTIYRQLPKDRRASLQAIVRALAKAVVLLAITTAPLHPPPDLTKHFLRDQAASVILIIGQWLKRLIFMVLEPLVVKLRTTR